MNLKDTLLTCWNSLWFGLAKFCAKRVGGQNWYARVIPESEKK